MAARHPQATLAAALGAASLFFPLLGPVAWTIGSRVTKEIDLNSYDGRGAANAGRMLGIVATGVLCLIIVLALSTGTTVDRPPS